MPEQIVSDRKETSPETVVTMGEDSTMQENEIDLLELGREVMTNRWVLLKFALVPAVITAITVLLMKPTYTAQASFLPPNSMSTGSSSFLSQLGPLGAAGGALSSLKDPTLLYVGMLSSRTVADDLIRQFDLAKEYETKKLSQTEKALERHSEFISGKDTIIAVSVQDHDPKRAADLANAYLAALHGLNDRIAFTEAGQRRLFFEQQLEKQKNRLADAEVELVRSQNQTGLIQPTGQARLQLETIAQTQAEVASREIELAAMSQAATEQNPDMVRIRSEIAGLKAQLNKLENSTGQGRAGNVQVPTSEVPELTLIYVRKERELKYQQALYELLLRQYEAAKLEESRSAPLMQVVDYAVPPDTKSGPKRILYTLLAAILGGLLGLFWVIGRYVVRPSRENKLMGRA
jgi:tyrosine-protein kinase Etk/Wzc